MLDYKEWTAIDVPDIVTIGWHIHPMRAPHHTVGWNCNGNNYFGKCLSNNMIQQNSDGKGRWRCDTCDFDLCQKCIQASVAVFNKCQEMAK
jgi:hypothetical protein